MTFAGITLDAWEFVGYAGQAMFGARFLVQWLISERSRRSVIPEVFWYLSLAGAIISLAYAVHLQSWPFTLGLAAGLIVYSRNIYFIWHHKRQRLRVDAESAV